MLFPRLTAALGQCSRSVVHSKSYLKTIAFGRIAQRPMSAAAAPSAVPALTGYSKAMSYMHWLTVPAVLGCVGTVLYAQTLKGKPRGNMMFWHKSLGLLTGIIAAPRVAVMLTSRKPAAFNTNSIKAALAAATHYGLYGFLIIMPATGVAMGYYGGFGLPFFWTKLSGAAEADKSISGPAFKVHKFVGYYGKFLIPLHVGAAGFSFARGEAIFARINPFRAIA
ncbi:hypothetical protein SARC_01202 [Sphaeroforma arctica JP610]|uniref:Cytochrome b561 bacterial/Ni-hydrogenase domain-containing protein n=1 Tax=Sphaeroforma arctica JP610 TaxID=667725 RepID=A0A0L0GCD5_9EUKA|nr:hypothetical protein SARC_01202 [Sphaeroforma arctica JP610]KNC86665.1 hypothetical protein SARC_01202 [Sphaeroforma arctica JP610]|eukprot:XP_014160567.1 hypothetical protein SARC_01202 [Sphaeroforma arctica JP610]